MPIRREPVTTVGLDGAIGRRTAQFVAGVGNERNRAAGQRLTIQGHLAMHWRTLGQRGLAVQPAMSNPTIATQ